MGLCEISDFCVRTAVIRRCIRTDGLVLLHSSSPLRGVELGDEKFRSGSHRLRREES